MKKFSEWGLANVHREPWAFGKGWSLVRFSAHMIEPQIQPLIGFPRSGRRARRAPVTADVVRVQIDSERGLREIPRQAVGKIVLTQPARAVRDARGAVHPADGRQGIRGGSRPLPYPRAAAARPAGRGRGGRGAGGVPTLAKVSSSSTCGRRRRGVQPRRRCDMAAGGSDLSWQQQHPDGGTIFPTGRRIARPGCRAGACRPSRSRSSTTTGWSACSTSSVPVKVELNVETKFYDETTPNGFNTIAEIPGTDPTSRRSRR